MGDPRKSKSKYTSPKKPWDKERLDAEKEIVKEYGVVNKTEIYKMNSMLRDFALRAKKLLSSASPQAEQEKKELMSKLHSLALTGENAQLDDVLALQLKNIMERRLQTLVLRKGLANTTKQARQFITHQHIKIKDRMITSPSYLVSKEEENNILFSAKSPLSNPGHPERPEQVLSMKSSKKKKGESKEKIKAADASKEIKTVEIKEENKEALIAKEAEEAALEK